MPVPFPEICSTQRQFTPGEYPTRRFTAINGAGRTRIYGSAAFDAALDLTFVLKDSELADLLECWNAAKGSYDELLLPAEVYAGVSGDVAAQFQDYLVWRFSGVPQVSSLAPGRSNVRVSLIGTLDD